MGRDSQDKRDTRAVIQAVADAYLDNREGPHDQGAARHALRPQGRMYTGTRNPGGNNCNMGAFPQKLKVSHRRYVIDETIGAGRNSVCRVRLVFGLSGCTI